MLTDEILIRATCRSLDQADKSASRTTKEFALRRVKTSPISKLDRKPVERPFQREMDQGPAKPRFNPVGVCRSRSSAWRDACSACAISDWPPSNIRNGVTGRQYLGARQHRHDYVRRPEHPRRIFGRKSVRSIPKFSSWSARATPTCSSNGSSPTNSISPS